MSDPFPYLHRAVQNVTTLSDRIVAAIDQQRGSNADVLDALRDTGLSVAAVDRCLSTFTTKLLERTPDGIPPGIDSLTPLPVLFNILKRQHNIHWKRLPPGGICSLLYHVNSALEDTNEVLRRLMRPSWAPLRSLFDPITSLLAALPFVSTCRTRLEKMIPNWLLMCMGFGLVNFVSALYNRFFLRSRLKRLNEQLLILVRLWMIAADTFERAQALRHRSQSYAVMVADLSSQDVNEHEKPIARRLMEGAAMPHGAAMWPSKDFRLGVLKRVLDVIYASLEPAWYISHAGGIIGTLLAVPLTIVAGLYFLCRPAVAAERAAAIMQDPDVNFIAHVWRMLDSAPARMIAMALARRRVELCADVRVEGIPCSVMSNDPSLDTARFAPATGTGTGNGIGSDAFALSGDSKVGGITACGAGGRAGGPLKESESPLRTGGQDVFRDGRQLGYAPLAAGQPLTSHQAGTGTVEALQQEQQEQLDVPVEDSLGPLATTGSGCAGGSRDSSGTTTVLQTRSGADVSDTSTAHVDQAGSTSGTGTGGVHNVDEPDVAVHPSTTKSNVCPRCGGSTARAAGRQPTSKDPGHHAPVCSCTPTTTGASGSVTVADAELPPVLLMIHGGGFVGCFWANDCAVLSRWIPPTPTASAIASGATSQPSAAPSAHAASTSSGVPTGTAATGTKDTRMLVVYPHYTLSPEVQFPTALRELQRVYAWLRPRTKRLVVAGESAGGNLSAALVLRLITDGMALPDAIVLGYPALCLNPSPSPSRALHINDPLVPIRLLSKVAGAYIGNQTTGLEADAVGTGEALALASAQEEEMAPTRVQAASLLPRAPSFAASVHSGPAASIGMGIPTFTQAGTGSAPVPVPAVVPGGGDAASSSSPLLLEDRAEKDDKGPTGNTALMPVPVPVPSTGSATALAAVRALTASWAPTGTGTGILTTASGNVNGCGSTGTGRSHQHGLTLSWASRTAHGPTHSLIPDVVSLSTAGPSTTGDPNVFTSLSTRTASAGGTSVGAAAHAFTGSGSSNASASAPTGLPPHPPSSATAASAPLTSPLPAHRNWFDYLITQDMYVHPLYAPDDYLRRFPPTYIIAGGLDPLLDDCVDFNTRLRRLGVPGELQVLRSLPHGFLNFSFVPQARVGIEAMKGYILDALGVR